MGYVPCLGFVTVSSSSYLALLGGLEPAMEIDLGLRHRTISSSDLLLTSLGFIAKFAQPFCACSLRLSLSIQVIVRSDL